MGQGINNFKDKMGLKGGKWSKLNALGTQAHLSHPSLELEKPTLLWGNKNWPPNCMKV